MRDRYGRRKRPAGRRSLVEAFHMRKGQPEPREECPMFRKILIAVVASLGLLSPLALPAQTDAHEAVTHRHSVRVYYRGCARESWHCAGTYRCREDAFREVHHLRARGFETMIR